MKIIELFTKAQEETCGYASIEEITASVVSVFCHINIDNIRVAKSNVYTIAGTKLASFTHDDEYVQIIPSGEQHAVIRVRKSQYISSYKTLKLFLNQHKYVIPIVTKSYRHYTYCVAVCTKIGQFEYSPYIDIRYPPVYTDPVSLAELIIKHAKLSQEQAENIIDLALSGVE